MEEIHTRPEYMKQLIIGDKVFKSSNDWEISEKEIEKARVELEETEEKKTICLQQLKEKLSNDKDVNYRTDSFYLLRFLRFRKYDVDEAYRNMKRFYDQKRKKPDFFTLPHDLKAVQDINFYTYLPYTDEEGRIILWMNMSRWKADEMPFEQIAQSACALYDVVTMNPQSQINGVICLCDAEGCNFGHLTEFFKKGRLPVFVTLMQNAYPLRIYKGIIFNCNQMFRAIFKIVRPFLKRKISERVVLLGSDLTELHKYVNPALLPKKYGGSLEEEECCVGQHLADNMPYLQYERTFS